MYNFKFMTRNEIEKMIEAGKNELEKRNGLNADILAEGDSALLIIEDIAERIANSAKSLGYELFIGCGDEEIKVDITQPIELRMRDKSDSMCVIAATTMHYDGEIGEDVVDYEWEEY